MDYNINPFGKMWSNGIFNVPRTLTEKYIRLASEYQLKALLIILSENGVCSSNEIAKRLGITARDAEEIMEFWLAEGIAAKNGGMPADEPSESKAAENTAEKSALPKKRLKITAPTLSPADIVAAAQENEEIGGLLNEAQEILGRTISHSESEMLVNMVNFYGLRPEVILMILEYWRSEKEKGKAKGTAYVLKIAQNWMEEGIETAADAEEKLKSVEKSNRYWRELTALAEIKYKEPTEKQRETVENWYENYGMEMISFAVDSMKNSTGSPSFSYLSSIFNGWKKKGIKTLADAKRDQEEFSKSKEQRKSSNSGEISRKPTYDLEKIKRDAMNNTDIKY